MWFKNRKWLLLIMLVLSVVFGYFIFFLKIDFTFDSFHPTGEKDYEFYKHYSDTFPNEDNAILVAFNNDENGIWEKEFLGKVDTFFKGLRTIKNVDTVISPTELVVYERAGMGVRTVPLIEFDNDSLINTSQEKLKRDSIFYSDFFAEDRSWIAGIVIVNPKIMDDTRRDSLCDNVLDHLEKAGLKHVVSGVPMIRTQFVEIIRDEIIWFISTSIILSVLMMFVLYRNFWSMLLPQIGVVLSMVWVIGFLGLIGKSLDMVGELLPTVVFVVAIADIVHLFTRYQQDLNRGLKREEAVKSTLSEIGLAIFLTSLTTAIGFASLYVSPLPPVKEFGLVAALGVMFAYAIAVIMIPNALMWIPAEKIRSSRGMANNPKWERFLAWLYHFLKKRQRWILVFFGFIVVISAIGMSRISFNSYLLDDIRENDPVKQNMYFFEKNFYGARSFEMAILPKKGKELTDPEILNDIDKLQEYMRSHERITPFLSIVNFIKTINRINHGGRDKFYAIPKTPEKIEETIGFGYASGAGDVINMVMNKSRSMGRISGRMGDVGSDRFGEFSEGLAEYYSSECDTNNFSYKLTGTGVITDNNVEFLRKGLFWGLALAFALIGLTMGLLFKSVKMLLIGIIPNIIPLLFTAGVMGFTGMTLRASTSIVFLVAFGIAVDDTIHFLSRFRIELREGNDVETAIKNATIGTGKALILTSLILFAGFIMLLSSGFGGTFAVGMFTALTLVMALLSDLILLPVLLRWGGIGRRIGEQNR